MARQNINIGATPDDGTGDPLRDAFDKTNDNFIELYSSFKLLNSVQDVIDNGTVNGDEITLNLGSYSLGSINLGASVIVVEGGTILLGSTSAISNLTTNSTKPTIIFRNGGFNASGLVGAAGVRINNTGTGACLRAEGSGTIVFFENLFSSAGSVGLEINDASGVSVMNYTIVNGGTGVRLFGSNNTGPILEGINPINCASKGIDIAGEIVSGTLRIRDANITSVFEGIDIRSDIQGLEISGDVESVLDNGLKISSNVVGGALISKVNISSVNSDAMNITGSVISSLIMNLSSVTTTDSVGIGLVGDAGSANITLNAIVSDSFIAGFGASGAPLSGITKKDLKWFFTKAGPEVTDSRYIGSMVSTNSVDTVIGIQGEDGVITAFADAGGGNTTVTSTGHGLSNGDPVSINNTIEYNGLFTISGVTVNTFEISRVFVTDEGSGNWESGWYKISGTSAAGSTIERFDMSDNNELQSLDAKTLPVSVGLSVSGTKQGGGGAVQYQFAVFKSCGAEFMKQNGSVIGDFAARGNSVYARIPIEVEKDCLISIFVRNVEGTQDFETSGFSVDIGLS